MPRFLALALTALLFTTACQRDALLAAGAEAPALHTTAHDGTDIDLRKLGKPAVVYFYPADDTPGCTAEACAFRDVWAQYEAAGVLVIGVSTQDLESKRAFAEKHKLPFPLVADTDESWAKSFGVAVNGGYASRVSFLLDSSGKIAKVYPDVDPGVHAQQILEDSKGL
jgi:peroxiredoxin Q/BCP